MIIKFCLHSQVSIKWWWGKKIPQHLSRGAGSKPTRNVNVVSVRGGQGISDMAGVYGYRDNSCPPGAYGVFRKKFHMKEVYQL